MKTAAIMLPDTASLLGHLNIFQFRSSSSSRIAENNNSDSFNLYTRSTLLQYVWLWEYLAIFPNPSLPAIDLYVFLDNNQKEDEDTIDGTKKDVPTSMTMITTFFKTIRYV